MFELFLTNKNIYYRHFQIKFDVRCKASSSLRTSSYFISMNLGIISLLRRPCVACGCIMCVLFQQIGSPWSYFKRLNCTPEKVRDAEVKLWTKCRLTSFTNFNAQFIYSLTICMLHYNRRHVSSINMPIFRRTNCIITASGIVTLCKRLYSRPDESRQLVNEMSILWRKVKKNIKIWTKCFT